MWNLPLAIAVAHLLVQHEVGDVGPGDEHALVAREAHGLADLEEALDLLVHAADGLHLAALVHRAGDGEALLDGDAGEGGEQGVELGGGGAVALDAGVGLLEDQPGRRATAAGRTRTAVPR